MGNPNRIADLFHSPPAGHQPGQIGIEIERIALFPDGSTLHYSPTRSSAGRELIGAKDLLPMLSDTYQWALNRTPKGDPIGLTCCAGQVTLEPGSQVELGSAVRSDIVSLSEMVDDYEAQVEKVTDPLGILWYPLGVNPIAKVSELDVIPSKRYHIMTSHFERRPETLGTSMMRLTTSVQINLDYANEKQAIEMLRVALAGAPLSYALFASSPIAEGRPTGYLSYRRHIWKHTDRERTGLLPFVFDADFTFDAYARYVWNRPLMFAQTPTLEFVSANGVSLAQIAEGALAGVETDANNQLYAVRQLFTEARLKPGYVEVRSIDGLRPKDRYAATAFWMGLLYGDSARELVLDTLGKLTPQQREELVDRSAKEGMKTPFLGKTLGDFAGQCLKAAKQTLKARGFGEEKFLNRVEEIIDDRLSPAEEILEKWHSVWKGDVKKLIGWGSAL